MLSILQSIHPKYCELIASGKKTIEIRKTKPRIPTPFKVYIYCCKPKKILRYVWTKEDYEGYFENVDDNTKAFCKIPDGSSPFCGSHYAGKVIGEYVCDEVFSYEDSYIDIPKNEVDNMCLSYGELYEYGNGKTLYGHHISNLKIYDQPKELSEFYTICEKDGLEQCGECPYLESYNSHYPCEDCGYDECSVDHKKPLTRAPQSWCYVEEIGGAG